MDHIEYLRVSWICTLIRWHCTPITEEPCKGGNRYEAKDRDCYGGKDYHRKSGKKIELVGVGGDLPVLSGLKDFCFFSNGLEDLIHTRGVHIDEVVLGVVVDSHA